MVSHNMAKTIGKSQDIGDVKKADNSQHNSGVSHFGKLGHGHGSFYSSFLSVKSEKNLRLIFGSTSKISRVFLYLIRLLRLNHKIKNANHGVTLKIKNSAINLYIFV